MYYKLFVFLHHLHASVFVSIFVRVCISVFVWLVANLLPRARHRQQLQIHIAEELLHVFYTHLSQICNTYFN